MRKFILPLYLLCAWASVSHAQLRIVQYNAGLVKDGFTTIVEQIGNEQVNGVAKPIDVIMVQEQQNATYVTNIANTLNGIYGPGAYAAAPYLGTTSGGGLPGMVYRTSTVTLAETLAIGTVNTSANARSTLRYKIKPKDYGDNAFIYLYNSHLKAKGNDPTSDAARRAAETAFNRANADALGTDQRVIFAGDLNTYSQTTGVERSLANLMAAGSPGSAQAFDPYHSPTNWSGTANRKYHTQSPATESAYGGQVLGGMNDRFDWQLSTAPMQSGRGIAIIPNSYRSFGNNGTHPLSGAINSASNTWNPPGITVPASTVLTALATASDHIPVVADYQLPAKMSVAASAIPSTVITGALVPINVDVTNTAPVATANGADKLDFTVASTGNLAGAATASVAPLATANRTVVSLDTSTLGVKSGQINVTGTSPQVANGVFSQNYTSTVIGHARPSFSSNQTTTSLSINLGIIARGASITPTTFSIINQGTQASTASLDLDSITPAGNLSTLSADLAKFTNLAAGQSKTFSTSLDTTQLGQFSTTYDLALSDQNLPGETATAPMSVSLLAQVAIAGDTNLDNTVNFADFQALERHFGQSEATWTDGDFNGDHLVDTADFRLLRDHFGESAETIAPAFSSPASVPEPGTVGLLALAASALMLRRK